MQTLGIALSAVEDGIRSWWCQVLDLRPSWQMWPFTASHKRQQEAATGNTQ